ncbi:hypothetical protein FB567DRAFT_543641 [Paraphoma chrysanthemicola]|uniref:BTB domain-containing protein n=1 Tax=Paraphoma chrysanthemicola TaxID=798071 RepID=A0A8K0W4G4_9PLEO|nr:hypothetical protein FB567DRAFT_543641 [Paraphoma chrysanthemicola]
MVKIVVGRDDDKRELHVHEALLTARSKFFASAMRKGWKEAEEKIVKLPDDEHDVFELYASLVYTGTVPAFDEQLERVIPGYAEETICNHPQVCGSKYESLVKLYVLAEKLQDTQAKNATVDALITKVQHESQVVNTDEGPCMPSISSIRTMYEATSHHCPGRQVLIDCFVWYGQCTRWTKLSGWQRTELNYRKCSS